MRFGPDLCGWHLLRISLASGLAVLLGGCTAGPDETQPVVSYSDSAGISVVHSHRPAWQGGSPWSVSVEPTLTIGSPGGDEAYTLFRVGAVVRMRSGHIAVANRGTSEVRVYANDGGHLFDLGGQGNGPGEFNGIGGLWVIPGDSIMVADGRTSRMTLYSPEGQLVRTVLPESSSEFFERFGERPFHNGDLLVQSRILGDDERPRSGLFPGALRVLDRHAPDGARLNRIGELREGQQWGFVVGGANAYTLAPFSIFWPPFASDGSTIYLGQGTSAEILQRAQDGSLVRVIRWATRPRPVDGGAIERFRVDRLGETAESRRFAEPMLEDLAYPEAMPVYQSLILDSDGFLWVEEYRPRWEQAARWWVFAPDGSWLGYAPVPPDLVLREVGADYLLGVVRDESDVEYVVKFTLSRQPL